MTITKVSAVTYKDGKFITGIEPIQEGDLCVTEDIASVQFTEQTIYNHEGLKLVLSDIGEVTLYHEGKRLVTMCDWELRAMVAALDSLPNHE